jgi:hypothetical protein
MRTHRTFKASSNWLGAVLLLSLFGTVAITSIDAVVNLYLLIKIQWHNLSESLLMMHPHRTVYLK